MGILKKKKQTIDLVNDVLTLSSINYEKYVELLNKYSKLNELPDYLKEKILSKNILSIFTRNFLDDIRTHYPLPDNTYKVLKAFKFTINDYEIIEITPGITIMRMARYETKKFINEIIIELEHPNMVIGEAYEDIKHLVETDLIPLIFVAKKHELIKI